MADMEVRDLPLTELEPNEWNPNQMDDDTFTMLANSLQTEGWLDPLQVVPTAWDPKAEDWVGPYTIIGGEHRWQAATMLGFETAPCVILDPEEWDQDRQKFVTVRLNVLSGELNPSKFLAMYKGLESRYSDEAMRTMMGFAKKAEFERMVDRTIKALPTSIRSRAERARKDIRTVDDLTNLLNRLFTEHGQNLPSNVMAFTWAGKEVLWIMADTKLWRRVTKFVDDVIEEGGDVAAAFTDLLEGNE